MRALEAGRVAPVALDRSLVLLDLALDSRDLPLLRGVLVCVAAGTPVTLAETERSTLRGIADDLGTIACEAATEDGEG